MASRFFEPVRARTITKILTGTQVTITNPAYPDINETGRLDDFEAYTGIYRVWTIIKADGTRFRSEGILSLAVEEVAA